LSDNDDYKLFVNITCDANAGDLTF
jgi:hypothetical protein